MCIVPLLRKQFFIHKVDFSVSAISDIRVLRNKYGSVTILKQRPNQKLPPRGGLKIKLCALLVRNIPCKQTSISYVNSSINLNLNKSVNV
jgi:hypothetical protein